MRRGGARERVGRNRNEGRRRVTSSHGDLERRAAASARALACGVLSSLSVSLSVVSLIPLCLSVSRPSLLFSPLASRITSLLASRLSALARIALSPGASQWIYQLAGVGSTLGISFVTGLATGVLVTPFGPGAPFGETEVRPSLRPGLLSRRALSIRVRRSPPVVCTHLSSTVVYTHISSTAAARFGCVYTRFVDGRVAS